jgi:hypothetical protein
MNRSSCYQSLPNITRLWFYASDRHQFPSGPWAGFYTDASAREYLMDLVPEFNVGKMTGLFVGKLGGGRTFILLEICNLVLPHGIEP